MTSEQVFDPARLDDAGLNRQAVFNLDELPPDMAAAVRAISANAAARQLILIAHAGRRLWECVQQAATSSANPIDDFSVGQVRQWFATRYPDNAYEIVYPGKHPLGLQRLGQLAGWHHATPFMVGIDAEWGTWYAYRAVVLADTRFAPTRPAAGPAPCDACQDRPCIAACPGAAMANGQFDLARCVTYRKRADSLCKATCVARTRCPVGSAHRYCDAQLARTYSISLRAIERYY